MILQRPKAHTFPIEVLPNQDLSTTAEPNLQCNGRVAFQRILKGSNVTRSRTYLWPIQFRDMVVLERQRQSLSACCNPQAKCKAISSGTTCHYLSWHHHRQLRLPHLSIANAHDATALLRQSPVCLIESFMSLPRWSL
jgi:hypothetical protein